MCEDSYKENPSYYSTRRGPWTSVTTKERKTRLFPLHKLLDIYQPTSRVSVTFEPFCRPSVSTHTLLNINIDPRYYIIPSNCTSINIAILPILIAIINHLASFRSCEMSLYPQCSLKMENIRTWVQGYTPIDYRACEYFENAVISPSFRDIFRHNDCTASQNEGA